MVRDTQKKKKYKTSLLDRAFVLFNYFFLALVAAIMLYPIINVAAVSFSEFQEYVKTPWMIFPKKFTTAAYELVLKNPTFWRSYANSVVYTILSTIFGLTVNYLFAWTIARKETKGKPFLMALIIFTMAFNAGLIPSYLNVQSLGLINNPWVLIIPNCFNAFNCVVMISFLRELPYELVEAAVVDGASEPRILFNVILPLSKPVLASIALFTAVEAWNGFFSAQIYIRDRDFWPIALVLKEILASATTNVLEGTMDPTALMEAEQIIQSKTIQYASVLISALPIMCIYPFLQKYFAKGVMVGSVKG